MKIRGNTVGTTIKPEAIKDKLGVPGGGGLSDTSKALLLAILRNGVYTSNQKANITALETELNKTTPHTHSYTSSVTTQATCTTNGVRTYICSCGHSYTEAIPATGHDYEDGVCTVCGASDPNHGGTEGDEPHTHSYSSSVTKVATCTTDGVRTYTCACGHTYTEPIPATGHNFVDGTCTVCGEADPNHVVLTSISATYSGGDVEVETALTDLSGIVVTATYSDGSTATVTDYTLTGTIAEGSNTITVVYEGKTATFAVTGTASTWETVRVLTSSDIKYGRNMNDGAVSHRAAYVGTDIPVDPYYIYEVQAFASEDATDDIYMSVIYFDDKVSIYGNEWALCDGSKYNYDPTEHVATVYGYNHIRFNFKLGEAGTADITTGIESITIRRKPVSSVSWVTVADLTADDVFVGKTMTYKYSDNYQNTNATRSTTGLVPGKIPAVSGGVYRISIESTVSTAQHGVNAFSTKAAECVNAKTNLPKSNLYDNGWDYGAWRFGTFIAQIPEKMNDGYDASFLAVGFRMSANNENCTDGFITRVLVEKAVIE